MIDQEIKQARRKWWDHRYNSKQRGIDFHLSFDEWWEIWQQSGHWSQRGCRKGQYVMSRYGDKGAYEVGNVFIQPALHNIRDSNCKPKSPATKLKMSLAKKGRALTAEHKAAISAAKKSTPKGALDANPIKINRCCRCEQRMQQDEDL